MPAPAQSGPEGRPACHRKREHTDACLSIVFAALAVTSFIEDRTGRPVKRSVRTARHYALPDPGRLADPDRRTRRHPTCAAASMSSEEHPHG
jgi:hypothetical protein